MVSVVVEAEKGEQICVCARCAEYHFIVLPDSKESSGKSKGREEDCRLQECDKIPFVDPRRYNGKFDHHINPERRNLTSAIFLAPDDLVPRNGEISDSQNVQDHSGGGDGRERLPPVNDGERKRTFLESGNVIPPQSEGIDFLSPSFESYSSISFSADRKVKASTISNEGTHSFIDMGSSPVVEEPAEVLCVDGVYKTREQLEEEDEAYARQLEKEFLMMKSDEENSSGSDDHENAAEANVPGVLVGKRESVKKQSGGDRFLGGKKESVEEAQRDNDDDGFFLVRRNSSKRDEVEAEDMVDRNGEFRKIDEAQTEEKNGGNDQRVDMKVKEKWKQYEKKWKQLRSSSLKDRHQVCFPRKVCRVLLNIFCLYRPVSADFSLHIVFFFSF